MKSAKVDQARDGDAASASGGGSTPTEDGGCRVGCDLSRWYPPLLVLSTVMAGVFCVLYVTKPIFLEAPDSKLPERVDIPLPSGLIAAAEGVGDQGPGGGILPVHLDPGLASLPGDPVGGDEPNQEVPPVAELEPLTVPKASKPLFRPLTPDEMPAPASEEAIVMESGPDGSAPGDGDSARAVAIAIAEPVDEAPDEEGEGAVKEAVANAGEEKGDEGAGESCEFPWEYPEADALVAAADGVEEDHGPEPVRVIMHASVLGEFLSEEESSRAAEQKQVDSTTAMRG